MTAEHSSSDTGSSDFLRGWRIALLGRFASMARRDVAGLLRSHGAAVTEEPHDGVDMLVVGEHGLPLIDESQLEDDLDPQTCEAIRRGRIELVTETQLWERLGLIETDRQVHRLYTPAMLAELLGVPVAIVRRWRRRGLIVPAREIHRLAYFDFREVATARRLAELLAAGVSPRAIERKLETLRGLLPGVERPLAQLSVIIEGKAILLRQGDGLVEPGGQLRFDFEATDIPPVVLASAAPSADEEGRIGAPCQAQPDLQAAATGAAETIASPQRLLAMAAELEEAGQLAEAAETYRAAMAAGGPTAEACFLLAELLYRLGDVAGARERYYMAIELDEDYVEARANLGCVLAETGQLDLAAAALAGALTCYPDYPDAHYHLAKTLDRLGRADEAHRHWQAFLRLAPDSPWADRARTRLQDDQ